MDMNDKKNLLESVDARTRLAGSNKLEVLLFTLGTDVKRPGVYELPFGSTYRDLIERCGGGTANGEPVRAVLPALSCGFVNAAQLDTPIAYETLRAIGTSPGCGGVRIVTPSTDVVALAMEIATFFMKEQCGQCPPWVALDPDFYCALVEGNTLDARAGHTWCSSRVTFPPGILLWSSPTCQARDLLGRFPTCQLGNSSKSRRPPARL